MAAQGIEVSRSFNDVGILVPDAEGQFGHQKAIAALEGKKYTTEPRHEATAYIARATRQECEDIANELGVELLVLSIDSTEAISSVAAHARGLKFFEEGDLPSKEEAKQTLKSCELIYGSISGKLKVVMPKGTNEEARVIYQAACQKLGIGPDRVVYGTERDVLLVTDASKLNIKSLETYGLEVQKHWNSTPHVEAIAGKLSDPHNKDTLSGIQTATERLMSERKSGGGSDPRWG